MGKGYLVKGFLFILVGSLGSFFIIEQVSFAEDIINQTQEKLKAEYEITYDKGKLSVNLENADIKQVLAEIGKAAKVELEIGEGLSGKINQAQFNSLSLKDALERLVGGKGYGVAMEYEGSKLVSVHISKKEGVASNLSINQMTVFQLADGIGDAIHEHELFRFREFKEELRKRVPKTEAEVLFLIEKVKERDKQKHEDKEAYKIAGSIAGAATSALHNIEDEKLLPLLLEYSSGDRVLGNLAVKMMRESQKREDHKH
jgi:hypothetical protein